MPRSFDFGESFGRIFRVLAGGFRTWTAISLIFAVPLVVIGFLLDRSGVAMGYLVPTPFSSGQKQPFPVDPLGLLLPLFAYTLLVQIHAQLTTAGMMTGIFCLLRGERPTIGQCISAALRRGLSVLALGLLQGLAITIGLFCCCVPGAMFTAFWYVAMPCLIVERIGIGDAFSRSQFLTQGYRWPVFAVAFLLFIIMLTIGFIIMAFEFLGPAPYFVLFLLHLILTPLLGAIGPGVVYHDLRQAKEGLDERDLEIVFD